jgi:hypothetical protein
MIEARFLPMSANECHEIVWIAEEDTSDQTGWARQ